MWLTAFSLIKRFYGPVAVAVAVFLAFLLFQASVKHLELRGKLSTTRTELAETAGKLADAEIAFANLIRDYNSAALESDNRERDLERQRLSAVDKVRGEYGARVTQLDRSLQLALDGLRHSADADNRRALKAAADAPADCRNYAADPRNLSVPDSELLIRIGAAADGVAGRLAYCDGYIKAVVRAGEVKPGSSP